MTGEVAQQLERRLDVVLADEPPRQLEEARARPVDPALELAAAGRGRQLDPALKGLFTDRKAKLIPLNLKAATLAYEQMANHPDVKRYAHALEKPANPPAEEPIPTTAKCARLPDSPSPGRRAASR